jgi:penicillin-binding protein 2
VTRTHDTAALAAIRQRSRIVRLAAFGVFLLIAARLGWLQLARGSFYRHLSEDNYVQGFEVRAPRGLIKDRQGEIIADNRAAFSITLSRVRYRDDELLADTLSDLLGIEHGTVMEKLDEV